MRPWSSSNVTRQLPETDTLHSCRRSPESRWTRQPRGASARNASKSSARAITVKTFRTRPTRSVRRNRGVVVLKQMTQPTVPDGANDHLRLSVRYHRSPRNRLFGQFDPQRPNSSTDRPAFHHYFPHGEVVDVVRCNRGADPFGCGRDQAIRLMQRHAVLGEFSAPVARLDGLCNTERRQAQPIEQTAGGTFLTLS